MGKKRKLPPVNEEKENDNSVDKTHDAHIRNINMQNPIYKIMCAAQQNVMLHRRYIKELQELYTKMDHETFVFTFIKMLKPILQADDANEYGQKLLIFCSKFLTSYETEVTHPVLSGILNWILSTVSNESHIRYRLCFFVNLILKEFGLEAALDDALCDAILEYMLARLRDISPQVRKQAVLAMQRLQVPDNPNDPVLCAYQYHLCSDPSAIVRQCVITCMGRNYHTIPCILERLWDIDEKVRRHTYMNLCSFPVRSYKVSQRLTLLEQGLNDSSESVRKTVIKFMLKSWVQTYQNNLIELIGGLKIDATEEEVQRFRNVAKQMLMAIFEQTSNKEDLIKQLPLMEEGDLYRCVPHDKMNLEIVLYWRTLNDHLQQIEADECDLILPELSTFCNFIDSYCLFRNSEMDNFAQMEFQYIMLTLTEILQTYDLSDEIGRGNLQKLLTYLLTKIELDHKIIEIIVRITESIMPNINERMQYFLEIIYDICELNIKHNDLVHDRTLLEKLLVNLDTDMQIKIQSLKVKILELEEQEANFVQQKEYIKAQEATDERNIAKDEYTKLLAPILQQNASVVVPPGSTLTKNQITLKGLYMTYHIVVSEKVHTLTPSSCKLFNDFICRHIVSCQNDIREWAMKCATAFSMLYELFAKEVYDILLLQFFKSNCFRIWDTAVKGLFNLLDRYGIDYFKDAEQLSKQRRTGGGRVLYNNTMDFLEAPEDSNSSQNNSERGVDVINIMTHLLTTCEDLSINRSIIFGFCRLVLRGRLFDRSDILEKLLKIYFCPKTDTSIQQTLSIFLENIVALNMQVELQPCLLPMVHRAINMSYDAASQEVSPETIARFFIDLTRQETSTSDSNIHNKIALSFLQEMQNNLTDHLKDLHKILSKELLTLKLNLDDNSELKNELKNLADKLINTDDDGRVIRNLINFKSILDGEFKIRVENNKSNLNESDEEIEDSETITTLSEHTNHVTSINNENANNLSVASNGKNNSVCEQYENTTTNEIAEQSQQNLETTFGQDNHLGIPSLRRSLYKSKSDAESEHDVCAPNTKRQNKKPKLHNKEEKHRGQAMTRRNLRRFPSKELAETTVDSHLNKKTQQNSDASTAITISDSQESSNSIANKEIYPQNNSQELNSSDAIIDSPTIHIPISANTRNLRLRSARNCHTLDTKSTTISTTAMAKGKKNNTQKKHSQNDEDTNTPLRNTHKRTFQKTFSPRKHRTTKNRTATGTANDDLGNQSSSSNNSPLRKQLRRDTYESSHKQSHVNIDKSAIKAKTSKSTKSPTGSISSTKENQIMVKLQSSNDKPKNKNNTTLEKGLSKQRKNSITHRLVCEEQFHSKCMTRNRLAIELNAASYQLRNTSTKSSKCDNRTKSKVNSCLNAVTSTDSKRKESNIANSRNNNRSSATKSNIGRSNQSTSNSNSNNGSSNLITRRSKFPRVHLINTKASKVYNQINEATSTGSTTLTPLPITTRRKTRSSMHNE